MNQQPIARLDVGIQLDSSGKFTYTGNITFQDPKAYITVAPGLSVVVFTLTPAVGAKNVAFTQDPFQWLTALNQPRPAPAGTSLLRESATEVILTVNNTNAGPDPVSFAFYVVALMDGKLFADDPILVEDPPT